MLKYIAILTMLIDHINLVLYDRKYYIMTLIGRFAFPLFALFIVRNYLFYSKSFKRYTIRLLSFAIISQPVVMIVFKYQYYQLNIFFSLLFGLIFIYSLDHKDYLLTFMSIIASIFSEYSILGLLLIYAIYISYKSDTRASYIFLAMCTLIITLPDYIIVSPFIFIMLMYAKDYKDNSRYIPGIKYLFYIFYPVHLVLLEMIR